MNCVHSSRAGAVPGDDKMDAPIFIGEQFRRRLKKGGVALPAPQHGDHADESDVRRQAEFLAQGPGHFGMEAREIDTGRDAGDAPGRKPQLRDEPVGDPLAGGDDMVRKKTERDAAPETVRVIDLDVARADEDR